jgi:hypothetical protein
VSLRVRIVIGWALLVVSIVGWPVSQLTWAQGEPPTTLGLSWAAMLFVAYDVLMTCYLERKKER